MKRMLTLLLLLAPLPMPAQKPTITIMPFTGSVLAPTAPFCGFDMIDTPQPNRPSVERLIHANGGALIAGPLHVQLKNANTGQIIDLNSSGPAPSITFNPDGTIVEIATGPSIWNYPYPPPLEVTQAAGLPPVPYIKGRVTVVIDQNGNITSMKLIGGTAENICSMF
jgi:hypothetical protein